MANKDLNWIEPSTRRLMDIAWLRSGDVFHTGESLVLACLLHVRKPDKRTDSHEEEIKEVLKVYDRNEAGQKKTPKSRKRVKGKDAVR